MIKDFLHFHNLEEVPLLLGLSGGPDSTALFHFLLELKHPFQVAHIDHGWGNPESGQEAVQLAQMCQKWEVSCHIRTLQLEGSNIEDLSRKARHVFFQEICVSEGLKGVLLGHHADDQAETVLKRVFEGASLPKLKGLSAKAQIGELILYRPLLKVRKSILLEWLDERGITYFHDPPNQDTEFLRSRMRKVLLPTLSQQFGKQIASSLCRLGEAAEELSEFLYATMGPFREQIVSYDGDILLDFNQFPPQSSFIYKAVIRDLFEYERLAVSKSVVETILLHLQNNSVHKTIQVGQRTVTIHRGILTIRKLKLLHL